MLHFLLSLLDYLAAIAVLFALAVVVYFCLTIAGVRDRRLDQTAPRPSIRPRVSPPAVRPVAIAAETSVRRLLELRWEALAVALIASYGMPAASEMGEVASERPGASRSESEPEYPRTPSSSP